MLYHRVSYLAWRIQLRRFFTIVAFAALGFLTASAFEHAAVAATPDGATLSVSPGEDAIPILLTTTRDFVSGEAFTTSELETLEVLFSDGTSLVLALNSRVIIEGYTYGRDTHIGSLRLVVEFGLISISGGALNDQQPIEIETPHASIAVEAGSAIVAVSLEQTRANLLHGQALRFTSGGETEVLERPEFQVSSTSKDEPPIGPTRMEPGAVALDMFALNPGLLTGVAPGAGPEDEGGDTEEGDVRVAGLGNDVGQFPIEVGQFPIDELKLERTASPVPAPCPAGLVCIPQDLDPDRRITQLKSLKTDDPNSFTELRGFIAGLADVGGEPVSVTSPSPDNLVISILTPSEPDNVLVEISGLETESGTIIGAIDLLGDDQSGIEASLKEIIEIGANIIETEITKMVSVEDPSTLPTLPGLSSMLTENFDDLVNNGIIINDGVVDIRTVNQDQLGLTADTTIRDFTFLEWGFFFGAVDGSSSSPLVLNDGVWVAGHDILPDADLLNPAGTVTFGGHLAGNVANQGALYSAVGTFANTWDLGARHGNVFIDFDNASFAGTTELGNGNLFTGNFVAIGGTDRAGDLTGSFYSPDSGGIPQAVGGQFSIGGEEYQAEGIFAGEVAN